MSNPNGAKGAHAERVAAKYLAACWPSARRALGAGRKDDRGDIHGIPHTVVQVKDVGRLALPKWIAGTLRQRDNDDVPFCLLVHKKRHIPVARWDAYMPLWQLNGLCKASEAEVRTWVRMELSLAVTVLLDLIAGEARRSPSLRSSSTTESS